MNLLPWHKSARDRICGLLEQRRLPHALLIRGPEGWGEASFANWLVFELLELTAPESVPDPAVAARDIAHPDLRWVQPEGAVIKVDDIRMLAEFAIGTRQAAPCKVAVIESAQQMNSNAANALLKTLEEPPADTYLILTTSQAGRLLPTVVSRCQSVVLEADESRARDWLLERWDEAVVDQRLAEYGHAPLEFDAALRENEPALLPTLADIAQSAQPAGRVEQLLEVNVDRLLARWYRCCIALAAGRIEGAWAAAATPAGLAAFTDELIRTRRQILYTNSANVRLLLERLAVSWRRMFAAVT